MSKEYPCVHWHEGKCKKFSDETVVSWCVESPCEDQLLSNADRIRAMTDKEMATDLLDMFEEITEDGVPCTEWMLHWLKQPKEE
jgi:hypothetical protein